MAQPNKRSHEGGDSINYQPCPICGQQPCRVTWRGSVILRCDHVSASLGTGSWRSPEVAALEWNEGVLAMRPLCAGEIYPCPVCGEVRALHSTDSYHIVQCPHWNSNFIYFATWAATADGAIENWNSGIRTMAQSLCARKVL